MVEINCGAEWDEGWRRARKELVARWQRIIECIEARDEGGVLALANVMDEFCEEAGARQADPGERPTVAPAEATGGKSDYPGRCLFCKGYEELGGCFGIIEVINRAVQSGHWDSARSLATGYLTRLELLGTHARP